MAKIKSQQAQNQASYLESLAHQMEQWVKHKFLILLSDERFKNNLTVSIFIFVSCHFVRERYGDLAWSVELFDLGR